jgi:hypothetical protein
LAFFIAFTFGLAGGVHVDRIIIRALLSGIAFVVLYIGAFAVMAKYLPELFIREDQADTGGHSEEAVGSRVNIVVPVDEHHEEKAGNDQGSGKIELDEGVHETDGNEQVPADTAEYELQPIEDTAVSVSRQDKPGYVDTSRFGEATKEAMKSEAEKKKDVFYQMPPEDLAKMMRTSMSKDDD